MNAYTFTHIIDYEHNFILQETITMTDTARRKDLIYPDVQTLNDAQFDSDSTPSPTHQHNSMLPQKIPITIDVATGFSSEEENGGANIVQTSQSCGQAELNDDSKRLTGKFIELSLSENCEIDERIQSTYKLFTKQGSKSLPRQKAVSVCLTNRDETAPHSNHSSPTHEYLSPASLSSRNMRCASPEIGGSRIHSNPFFVQDRLSRSNLERQRLDSAPANMNLKITNNPEIRSQSSASVYPSFSSSLSTSKSFSHTTGTSVNKTLSSVDIQSRIKLWAEKEKEAKEIKELERIRSPSGQKSNSSSPQRSYSNTPPKVFDLISSPKSPVKIVESPEENNKVQKKHSLTTISSTTTSPSNSPIKGRKSRSGSKDSSSEQNSDTSPRKSRWKLKSPLFRRKKNSEKSLSVDSEQSDENMLSGSNEKVHKISRTSHKRKAIKKKLSSTLSMPRSASDDTVIRDDHAIPANKPPLPGRQRSNSVGPKQGLQINRRRAISQPNIHKVHSPEIEGDYMIVRSKRLDPDTQTIIGNSSNSLSTEVIMREEKGRKTSSSKRKTISGDIRDIIESLGTSSLNHGDGEGSGLSLVNESVMSPELQSSLEKFSPPESQQDIVIQKPVASGPNLFSDEEETYIPRGEWCSS